MGVVISIGARDGRMDLVSAYLATPTTTELQSLYRRARNCLVASMSGKPEGGSAKLGAHPAGHRVAHLASRPGADMTDSSARAAQDMPQTVLV